MTLPGFFKFHHIISSVPLPLSCMFIYIFAMFYDQHANSEDKTYFKLYFFSKRLRIAQETWL